jgi:S-adenosylhomocysteine hydrolase
MKDKAIVCNIGHFDNEIDMAWLNKTTEYQSGDQATGGQVHRSTARTSSSWPKAAW